MNRKHRIRRAPGSLFLAAVLILSALFGAASAEGAEALLPYSEENGYTYVYFGRYPQSIDGGSPDEGTNTWSWRALYRDWEKETRKELGLKVHDPIDPWDPGPLEPDPILWRVLSADDEKIYLMSEYVLFASPLHTSMAEYRDIFKGDFARTAMCLKLNGEFADTAFTEAEKEALIPFDSYGSVSLPSADDMKNGEMGFSKKKAATRKAMATEYAIRSTGAFVYQTSKGCHSPYWMREQATSDGRHGRSTKQDGNVGHLHCDAVDVGARPVVNLAAGGFRIDGGSGTKDDPYMLSTLGE